VGEPRPRTTIERAGRANGSVGDKFGAPGGSDDDEEAATPIPASFQRAEEGFDEGLGVELRDRARDHRGGLLGRRLGRVLEGARRTRTRRAGDSRRLEEEGATGKKKSGGDGSGVRTGGGGRGEERAWSRAGSGGARVPAAFIFLRDFFATTVHSSSDGEGRGGGEAGEAGMPRGLAWSRGRHRLNARKAPGERDAPPASPMARETRGGMGAATSAAASARRDRRSVRRRSG
jgi:hypothetical protein